MSTLKREGSCTLFPYFSLAVILPTFLKSLNLKTGLDEQCPILRECQVRDHPRNLNMYKSMRRKILHPWVLRKLEDKITKPLPIDLKSHGREAKHPVTEGKGIILPFLKRVKRRNTGEYWPVILTFMPSKVRNRYSFKWCWSEWNTGRWLETVFMASPREKCAGLLQWPLMKEELRKWTREETLMCLSELA